MGMKDCCKVLAESLEAAKLTRKFGPGSTHRDNVVRTQNVRGDLHKDFHKPGWAILNVQVNKDAKDPGAKEFLKKGNTGSHKTTHKVVTSIRFSQDNLNLDGVVAAVRNAYNAIGMESTVESVEPVESSGGGYVKNDVPSMTAGQEVREWVYDGKWMMDKYRERVEVGV